MRCPAQRECDSAGLEAAILSHGPPCWHHTIEVNVHVAGLWRYPVKSLAGEAVSAATIGRDGLPFDRVVQVYGPEGLRTARRYYRLLGLRGTIGPDRRARIDGHPWDSPEALALVKAAAGDDAWLEADGEARFDVLPLLVATDGAVAAFGRDVRRLRPNILIAGVDDPDVRRAEALASARPGLKPWPSVREGGELLAERGWPGAELHIGDAIIRIDSLRGRCPMTTVDPDTLDRDPEVLRDIGRRFGGRLALNADVVRGGLVRVSDAVKLVRPAIAAVR